MLGTTIMRIRLVTGMVILCSGLATMGRSSVSCDPIITFADGKQPLREIFVSPSGSDSSGNGSVASPYATLTRARQGIQPGDAIRLLPGTYPGATHLQDISGTASAPIWLGGVPGQPRPILNGGNTGLQLSRVRYFILENLEVQNATSNGINCDDGGDFSNANATRHVLFRNLAIRDIGTGGNQDGLKLSGVNDYFVLDCEFLRMSAGGSGIDHVGCHGGLIARSTFTQMGSTGIQCKGGSENIEVRWNRFFNGGMRAINIGGSTGAAFFRPPLSTNASNFEAKNIRVVANLFRGSDAPFAFVGAVDSLVANNTIVDPNRWIFRILQETLSTTDYTFLPCGNNRFVNNLCWFDRSRLTSHVNIGPNTDAASFQFAANLWYAHNQPGQSAPALPSPEMNGITGQNPRFNNVSSGDYSVPADSIAAGNGLKLAGLYADLLELCYSDAPTIGAFEARPVFLLHSPELVAGEFVFRFPSATGRVYRVQSRTIANGSDWADETVKDGTGGEMEFRRASGTVTGRLFRVKLELP